MAKSPVAITAALALVSSFLTMSVKGMSDHVPPAACTSMTPQHEADPQTSTPPYVLKVPAGSIPVDSVINVVVSGVDPSIMFKGFFIKGFNDATGQPTGMFTDAPKTMDCDSTADGATHADAQLKESVVLAWKPPTGFQGSVTFMATIVMERPIFWTGVVSDSITFA
ncbi:defense protein l(2)34Fc-like [Palaemon carinicauda]|uniref:defense protein l(2)34Fc-like n=1 Tax=Palaemon carinicauda TaxID=392227 RepID=UPI0035B64AF9